MAEILNSSLLTDAIAYYRGESGALTTDSKGSYTLTNTNSVTAGTGKYGGCFDFGAANSNKEMFVASEFGLSNTAAFSLSAWVKPRAEISSGIWTFAGFANNGTPFASWRLQYDYNGGTRRVVFYHQGATIVPINHTITLGTTDWTHLCVTKASGATAAIIGYVNGASVGTVNADITNNFALTASLYIGSYYSSQYASALVDDVGLFNRVLTADEVLSLYEDRAGGGMFLVM